MTKYVTRILLLALLSVSLAGFVCATPINCAVTPSNPACAPSIVLTYQVGHGSIQKLSSSTPPTFTNGAWFEGFVPQVFPAFLFTGGQLVTSPDPFVGFSFGVINNSGSAMTFNYDFITVYAGGPYHYVRSVFGDTLVDTNFTGTSTVAPVGSSYIMNTYDTGTLLPQVGLGLGCTTPANVFVCASPDTGAIGPLVYISSAAGTLEVKGSFILSSGGQYTLTGRSDLLPIPETGTLALLGTGIVALAGVLRRKMNL